MSEREQLSWADSLEKEILKYLTCYCSYQIQFPFPGCQGHSVFLMWQGLSSSTEALPHFQMNSVGRNSGPSAKLRFSCKTTGSCFRMAGTNLFFVLFSGRRCPSQKLRTHLFWGISQNLPPSSQEPTEDVLPLWSPACLLQEGNLWMLATAVLMDLSELPLHPFVSLILPGLMCSWHGAFSVHSLQSFLWGPGVFCAPEHSNQLLA